ncbi:transposable element Tcb1 transposase [Trichonephila clavipes]|nr:transposable element Tcb1 transposase [Trichonephila clavipes]
MLNSCVMHRHTAPVPGIIVRGGIGYHSRTPLVRITSILNRQRYISEVLELVVLPYLQGVATSIFQQDNARPHVARIFQRFFVNHQIELLHWSAHPFGSFADRKHVAHGCSTIDQDYTPAATLDQLWQRVEAAWSAVPQNHIQSIFELMPRCVAEVISKTAVTLATVSGRNHILQKSINVIILDAWSTCYLQNKYFVELSLVFLWVAFTVTSSVHVKYSFSI